MQEPQVNGEVFTTALGKKINKSGGGAAEGSPPVSLN